MTKDKKIAAIMHTMTKVKFKEILNKCLHLTQRELEELLRCKDTPMVELMVYRVALESFKKGDQNRLEFLLERLIGKAPQFVDDDGHDTTNARLEELIALFKRS